MHRTFAKILSATLVTATLAGCDGVNSPSSSRPEKAEVWYRRAAKEFKEADFEEAHDSAQKALAIVPEDPEVKTLAAEVALTALDYAEVLRLLKGVKTTDAARLRGRALWYKGDLDAAADELETMLNDPEVKDEWAKSTSKLARRGQGRTPFNLGGAMLAAVEMVHVSPVAPFFVVPVEIDGEAALAMIATGSAEVVLDSATRPEPSWVSLRFGEKLEVRDVPALAQDLSGISKELGAPIKALLGVNLLRHLNATFDFNGRQFVVRNFAAPPPPSATRVDLRYARGGGLLIRSAVGGEKGPRETLMVDTARPFQVALDSDGWKKAGFDAASLKVIPGDPEQKMREGLIPMMRLGAFDVARVQGISGVPLTDMERAMGVDLDGLMGAGFLYTFRCTLADSGRVLWVEDGTSALRMLGMDPNPPGAPGAPPAAGPVDVRDTPPAAPPKGDKPAPPKSDKAPPKK
ncbi:Hypothetical protein A7982_04721 [Minicystis rosea]|nr:Hypothetical protein A7982_04721 [Minicystis rosea]